MGKVAPFSNTGKRVVTIIDGQVEVAEKAHEYAAITIGKLDELIRAYNEHIETCGKHTLVSADAMPITRMTVENTADPKTRVEVNPNSHTYRG